MRLLEQTELGFPRGNCVRAAWSSLLGVPLSSVPDFSPAAIGKGTDQLEEERQWVRGLGFDLVVVPATGDPPNIPEHVVCLISGLSPRGFGHRCVGIGGKLVWDPHPSHLGLVEVWSYMFLVPLIDPTLEIAEPEAGRFDMIGAASRDRFDAVEAEVVQINKRVSPWLWILSAAGFGMAVLNRYQIGSMFGSYKKMKERLW